MTQNQSEALDKPEPQVFSRVTFSCKDELLALLNRIEAGLPKSEKKTCTTSNCPDFECGNNQALEEVKQLIEKEREKL